MSLLMKFSHFIPVFIVSLLLLSSCGNASFKTQQEIDNLCKVMPEQIQKLDIDEVILNEDEVLITLTNKNPDPIWEDSAQRIWHYKIKDQDQWYEAETLSEQEHLILIPEKETVTLSLKQPKINKEVSTYQLSLFLHTDQDQWCQSIHIDIL